MTPADELQARVGFQRATKAIEAPTGILVQKLRNASGRDEWCADLDGLELAGPLGWGHTKDEAVWNLLDCASRHDIVTFEQGHALPVREVRVA